ncbi:MAG: DUF2752 domain-containing protein [Phycisphaerales bacterium]|nr:DUF2752 domain-containing protein [Phycisphaerales bacterium]
MAAAGAATVSRWSAAGIAAGLALVLGVAAWLEPAPLGYGTHRQLGLPPCGWMVAFNLPCPACGMTTSFALAADGRLLDSARVQPFGLALAIATVAGLCLASTQAILGWPVWSLLLRLVSLRLLWVLGAALLLSWCWKIAMVRGWWQP